MEMNASLELWEQELMDGFKPNPTTAYEAAKKLGFRFSEEDANIATYLRKKAALLREASVRDEQPIIYNAWEGLDLEVKRITPILGGEKWFEHTIPVYGSLHMYAETASRIIGCLREPRTMVRLLRESYTNARRNRN